MTNFDTSAKAAINAIELDLEFITEFVSQRKRFENWLQERVFTYLNNDKTIDRVEREHSYPDSQERCDIWYSKQGQECWIELKCCVTNYLQALTDSSVTQNITNEIGEIVWDTNKLRRLPSAFERRVVFLGYPLPIEHKDHPAWKAHLKRVADSPAELVSCHEIPVEKRAASGLIVVYDYRIGRVDNRV